MARVLALLGRDARWAVPGLGRDLTLCAAEEIVLAPRVVLVGYSEMVLGG